MKQPFILLTILIVMVVACRCGGKATSLSEPPAPATQASGPAGRCGDGVCSGPENAAYCPADCAAPTETPSLPTPTRAASKPQASRPAGHCGDGECDAYERQNPQVCPQDCEALPTTEPASTVTAAAPPTPTSAPAQTPSSPPAPSPTQTPLPPPTPTSTPASVPDLRVSALGFSPNHLFTGTPFHVLAQLHNDGTQTLSGVTVRVEDHLSQPQASCSNMNMVNTLHETTVNLDAGQLLPVDYSVQIDDAWEHLICVKVDPDDAIAESDESNNAQGQSVIVGTLTTISLDEANSGSVRHDGGANFTLYDQAQPGDGPNDKRVKGFLSWDLSPITPGAQILSASVTWGTQCFRGGDVGDCTGNRDPFPTLGNLEVWAHHYDTLDIGDFKFTGMFPGTQLFTYTGQLTGSEDVTEAVADAFAAGHPFQIYVLFQNHSDNNGIGNGLIFPEGTGPNMLEVVHIP